jgi:hypothetical protein
MRRFYITRRPCLEGLLCGEVEELTQWFFEAMDVPEKSRIPLRKSSFVAFAVWRYGGNGDLTTTSHSPPRWTRAAVAAETARVPDRVEAWCA